MQAVFSYCLQTISGDKMKQLKCIVTIILAVLLMILSCSVAMAETIYTVDGYSYSLLSNKAVALCGWDNRTPELIVPDTIIDKSVLEISEYGLSGNSGFSLLDFSKASMLSTIGYCAFKDCSGIANDLLIPSQITVIGYSAFENCISLPSVTINGDVSKIQNGTFRGCSEMSEVFINGETQSIEYQAFADCPKLTYIEIPKSVSFISVQAFKNSHNVVIACYNGSYAHQYAEDNRIDHIILDGPKNGDVNGDGAVDILDATEIQKYAAESTDFTDEQFELGDINKDGYCDVIDALLVQKSVIGAYEIPPIVIRY